jgi:transglutaminase-like putative cysteine protease
MIFPPSELSPAKIPHRGRSIPHLFSHAHPEARLYVTAFPLRRPCVVSNQFSVLRFSIPSREHEKEAPMLRKVWVMLPLLTVTLSALAQDSRHFTFHYAFTVKNVPASKKVRIWMPVAQSDAWQEVKILSAKGNIPVKKTREKKKDLQADRLVPITGLPADLAAKVTQGKTQPLDKARAIYDYVFATMKYDKTGTGWGYGDVLYACDAKKGNCTDFHSLFIAMARSQGIPARFEIGFPLPPDKHSAEIAGYHCWSDFYIDGKGWIPVDISEAWKHQEKRDYFFGSHDVNRVQFSTGRDLRLTPPPDGKPLNYFVYPYVEVDGQEYPNVSLAFSFADLGPTVALK